MKWAGKEYKVLVDETESVEGLKRKLEDCTRVQVKRQKLLGLKTKDGKAASDTEKISNLQIKATSKIMMMGQPEEVIEQTAAAASAPVEVQDDFDLTAEQEDAVEVQHRPEVQEKLARRIRSVELQILNPPRPGKKCLVLDIDYTLFDLNSSAERPEELARPYLHEFLTAAYEHFDILIWSATSKKWVEVKMRELGVLGNPNYKLVTLMDHQAMLTVQTDKYGLFDCKPLAFIWAKFPEFYNEHNTIMMDDLRRNYVLNKQQGLVIRPYKRAHTNRHTDKELLHLSRYLVKIGRLDRLSHLDHRRWERYLQQS